MSRSGQALIAERLQLSQATVSRALRNHSGISSEVKARVLSVAGEVGYLSKPTDERSQVLNRANFVGVLVRAENDRWRRGGYLMGMSEASPQLNITPCVHHVPSEHCEEILDNRRQPPLMRDGMIQGLVLVFRWPLHIVNELSQRFNCVSLQHEYPGAAIDVVGVNAGRAMADLGKHLYDLGHRQIGFFGRCPSFGWAERRFDGYLSVTTRLGAPYMPERVIAVEPPEIEAIERPGDPWGAYLDAAAQQTRMGVTAWMTASDYLGYQLCRGLQARGLSVPRDVSVTGFDVSEHGASGCRRLTSVVIPSMAMGASALSQAQKSSGKPGAPRTTLLFDCELALGETTAVPPTR